jgi:Sec-independent protein translocase protein TatA
MNFLGMGTLEILIVLLIAFIFLGPERMVDAARKIGKVAAEVRRMAADLPELTLEEEESNRPASPIIRRNGGPVSQTSQNTSHVGSNATTEETPAINDGPVAHQRVNRAKVQVESEGQAQQERRSDE